VSAVHPAEPDLSLPGPRQPPLEVAPGTFVLRALTPSLGGTWTNLNAMVILAEEPVLVDTGMVTNRAIWFEDVFALVQPEAVRWLFVSHCDNDHAGNMIEALERCANARLVISRGESYRTAACFGIPAERMLLVDHGQTFAAGDRVLAAIRPPVYDSPYSRGLFDPTTGVYYAADAFCAPMPEKPVDWAEEMPQAFWAEGMARFHYSSLCPWVALVERGRFRAEVDALARLGLETIVSAHSPAIGKAAVPQALELLAGLPDAVSNLG
jgi:flavorubredoxin